MKTDFETRERLRKNLPTIRNVAGWSAERLAELLDISRATMVTLENSPGKMTVVQYLALRALLAAEVAESGNTYLGRAVSVLMDEIDAPEEEKEKYQQAALAAKKVGRKAGSAAVQREALKTISEMKLSEIPPEDIARGKAFLEELLSRPAHLKNQ